MARLNSKKNDESSSSSSSQPKWKAGSLSDLPVSELVTELKNVHEMLTPKDQDNVDRSDLVPLAEQLVSTSLMKHKDRAVRTLTACGLANILRLFAPDAPFTVEQLEMMFGLFIQQLKGLAEVDQIYYNYHYFLLESLSTVKSIVLVFDLPDSTLLIHQIIVLAFDLFHPNLPINVRNYLFELVQTLVEECEVIPNEIVNEVIENLGGNSDSIRNALAIDIVKGCGNKLQPYLGQHFNEMLGRIGRGEESDAVLTKLGKEAHEFAVKIATVSPNAAQSILTLLEEELKVENVDIRVQAIGALARIFNESVGTVMKVPVLTHIWGIWLGKRNDKAFKCRIAWIRGAVNVYMTAERLGNAGLADSLGPVILEKFQDIDERVRLANIECLHELMSKGSSTYSVIPVEIAEAVADRCMDNKEGVQAAALSFISDWLVLTMMNAQLNRDAFIQNYSSLLNKIFQLVYTEGRSNGKIYFNWLDRDLLARISQIPTDKKRTVSLSSERLTWLYACLDEKGKNAFRVVLKRKARLMKGFEALIKLSKAAVTMGDSVKVSIIQVAQLLAESSVNELEAQRVFVNFPDLVTRDALFLDQLLALIKSCTLNESLSLSKKIENHLNTVSGPLKTVLLSFLPLVSMISVNSGLIVDLISLAAGNRDTVHSLMQDILQEFPHLFANRSAELIELTCRSEGATDHLIALSRYAASFPLNKEALDSGFLGLLETILQGRGNFDAKRVAAATAIACNVKGFDVSGLAEDFVLQLPSSDGNKVRTALAGLDALLKACPESAASLLLGHFETFFDFISSKIYSESALESLSQSSNRGGKRKNVVNADDLLADWPLMKDLRAEEVSLCLCVKFLSTFVQDLIRQHKKEIDAMDIDVTSSVRSVVVGFFLSRLEALNGGDFAGLEKLKYSLIKGAILGLPDASPAEVVNHLLPVFLACQDSDHRLRFKLMTLLGKSLLSGKISAAYLPVLFFALAHEPLSAIKSTGKNYLLELTRNWTKRGSDQTSCQVEDLLPVLIVYLAWHPDYHDLTESEDTRSLAKTYFDFFVDVVVRADNAGYIYERLGKLKFYQIDSGMHGNAESCSLRMYFASELAQKSIRERCAQHHWPLSMTGTEGRPGDFLLEGLLAQLPESGQLRNIHHCYLMDVDVVEVDGKTADNNENSENANTGYVNGKGKGRARQVQVRKVTTKRTK